MVKTKIFHEKIIKFAVNCGKGANFCGRKFAIATVLLLLMIFIVMIAE